MASPEVLEVTPPDGTEVAPTAQVGCDVRSATPFRRVILSIKMGGFEFREVAFDGDPALGFAGFEELYTGSTITAIVDPGFHRYRFRLMRSPGTWVGSPVLYVTAIDQDGDEAP